MVNSSQAQRYLVLSLANIRLSGTVLYRGLLMTDFSVYYNMLENLTGLTDLGYSDSFMAVTLPGTWDNV